MQRILNPELEKTVISLLESCGEIYLVGGIIRDKIKKISSNDIDFVVKRNAIVATRRIADHFGGKFYILDNKRGTGRALIELDTEPLIIDFATISGNTIFDDLRARDFTINAIAVNMADPQKLMDPLNGRDDLEHALLKPCSVESFNLDPVRTIRTIRFMQYLDLILEPSAVELIKQAIPLLANVSAERKRDEMFRILEIKDVKKSLNLIRDFGLWNEVFPGIIDLEQIKAAPPHVNNALEHTLQVIDYSQVFLDFMRTGYCGSRNKFLISGFEMIKEYRQELKTFLDHSINAQRKYDGLLFLAGLYHDIGKTRISPVKENQRVIYPEHAAASADVARQVATSMMLSNEEIDFVEKLVRYHMGSGIQDDLASVESRREIYRFYKRAGYAGVLVSIIHLADILATYEDSLSDERWKKAISSSQILLEAWFRQYQQIINPPALVNGNDLINEFCLKPGLFLGEVLEKIREAQASGEITDRKMAFESVLEMIERRDAS